MLPQLKLFCVSMICFVVCLFLSAVSSRSGHTEMAIKQRQLDRTRITAEGKQSAKHGVMCFENPYLDSFPMAPSEQSQWWFNGWMANFRITNK
jgi:hypothetical protein